MPRMRSAGKMTVEEHEYIGSLLALNQRYLMEVENCFRTSDKAYRLAFAAQKALDKLRCELDNVICNDYPELPNEVACGAYYGRAFAHGKERWPNDFIDRGPFEWAHDEEKKKRERLIELGRVYLAKKDGVTNGG